MLDGLGRRDQCRVQHLLFVNIARDFARFLEDSVNRRAIDALSLDAVHLEHFLKPGDLALGFGEMRLEPVLEAEIARFLDHVRKVLRDLLLGVIDILQRMHEEVVQRL